MNKRNRNRNRNLSPRRELERITRIVVVSDAHVAETAMREYAWERRGLLGRLVRTQRVDVGLEVGGGPSYGSRLAS